MHQFSLCVAVIGAMISASAAFAQTSVQTPTGIGWPPEGPAISAEPPVPGNQNQDLLPSLATGQRGVQVRTNVLTGKNLQAGPAIDYHPNASHPETPALAVRRDQTAPVELGGFVGYLFHDEATGSPTSSIALDLQVATDPLAQAGGWLVQPGLGYTTPLAPSWQLNTRLFSTYAPDGSGTTPLGLDYPAALRNGSSSDAGFQDVGVGLGLGYSISDSWNIQTQARYQRMLGATEANRAKEVSPHQFFGGVMIDYKF
jgi:opacity protein-like surface antigen